MVYNLGGRVIYNAAIKVKSYVLEFATYIQVYAV